MCRGASMFPQALLAAPGTQPETYVALPDPLTIETRQQGILTRNSGVWKLFLGILDFPLRRPTRSSPPIGCRGLRTEG